MTPHVSFPREKIRFLLLEGIHESAVETLYRWCEAARAALPQLKAPGELAEAHYLIGAAAFFQEQYEPAIQSLLTSVKTDLKSLVWYKPAAFADAGYTVPETIDDFNALIDFANNIPNQIGDTIALNEAEWRIWLDELQERRRSDDDLDSTYNFDLDDDL